MKTLTDKEEQIRLVAVFLMEEHGLNGWTLGFRKMYGCLGKCFHSKKLIKLSTYYIKQYSYKTMINTILHEIAHSLTKGHGHDLVWRQKAKEIGAIPRATRNTADNYINGGS